MLIGTSNPPHWPDALCRAVANRRAGVGARTTNSREAARADIEMSAPAIREMQVGCI